MTIADTTSPTDTTAQAAIATDSADALNPLSPPPNNGVKPPTKI
jgi:hypothetical protein